MGTFRKHGRSVEAKIPPVYAAWRGMRQRCGNPNNTAYSYYGGRGISVCERWNEFNTFLADMGEPPAGFTLDRIDTNGNYEPGNCRWASWSDQMRNRRKYGTPAARGAGSWRATLTWEQVAEIRQLAGSATHKVIAQRFGVSRPTISKILRGDSYQGAPA